MKDPWHVFRREQDTMKYRLKKDYSKFILDHNRQEVLESGDDSILACGWHAGKIM